MGSQNPPLDLSSAFQQAYRAKRTTEKRPRTPRRKYIPDPDKRKGFKLACGHYESGGIEIKPFGKPIMFECFHGCTVDETMPGMQPRMSAKDMRRRAVVLPEEPGF